MLSGLTAMDGPRKQLAGLISGLDIHYDLGEGHPLLGRRMPDLDLGRGSSASSSCCTTHGRCCSTSASPGAFEVAGDVSRWSTPTYKGDWELPVLGWVSAPAAVLIRPDGYVAWVGDGTDAGLADALVKWFG